MVILDTNIIIDHLRQLKNEESLLRKIRKKIKPDILGISTITIQELFTGTSTRSIDEEKRLVATLAPIHILPYTYEVAKKAGEIARDLKIQTDFADCAIASTAILNKAKLFTLNKKHFVGIPNLKLI